MSFIDAESSPLHRRDTVFVESTPFSIRSPAHEANADGDYELQTVPLVPAAWDDISGGAAGGRLARFCASTTANERIQVSSYSYRLFQKVL